MQKYQDVVLKYNGAIVPNATVTVQSFPGAVNSTIYSDNGITTTTNPLTSGPDGTFSFYAADGRYQLVITGLGIGPTTRSDILLIDTGITVAVPAGGTAGLGVKVSSVANFGVFFGSGVPTLAAGKGSLYLRTDGSATNNRMYVNTDGAATWTAVTTAA